MLTHSEMPIPCGWFVVEYSDNLAVGEAKPLRYFDRELVLYRGQDGTAAVLDAYCPHLGAHLGHGGEVIGNAIACPFHGWQLDAGGCVIDIPYASQIPAKVKSQERVKGYHVSERNGAIWVWFHPEELVPQYEVAVIDEAESEGWQQRRFEWEIKTTVQEMGENAVDGPHFQYVHGSVVPPEFEVEIKGHQRKSRIISKMPSLDDSGKKDVSGQNLEESITESWSNGPGQSWQRFHRLPNTILMGLVTPIDTATVHLRFCFVQKQGLDELEQLYVDGATTVFKEQVEQDIPIWENKVYYEEPYLCDGDGPIAKYRRWFEQFYISAA